MGYSIIIVGFILGAITGTVAAQVIAMALITLPVMMRYKYDMRYATGVLAASGTITQLVPPSLVLVVLADQLGKSVGDMYLGAWGPSLLQIALFAAYTFYADDRQAGRTCRRCRATLFGWPLLIKCLWGIIPSAVLIFLVLGTIMMGLATPTEAGAMGTIGAIVLAVVRNAPLTQVRPHRCSSAAVAAAIVGALIGIVAFKSMPFKIAFTVMFAVGHLAVLAGLAVQGSARPDRPGHAGDHAHHRDGRLHPGRRDLLLDLVRGCRRRSSGSSTC